MILEQELRDVVEVLVGVTEAAGAAVIFVGVVLALVRFVVVGLRDRNPAGFISIRLDFGRFIVLGLEFLLAADLLNTAIAPTFEQIGKLAAIAGIRTALNYFLEREIKQERAELEESAARRG